MELIEILIGLIAIIVLGRFAFRGADQGHFTTVLKDDIQRKGGKHPKREEERK